MTIIDDRFLRVGPSSLNNRSLKVDTGCDLMVMADVTTRPARDRFSTG